MKDTGKTSKGPYHSETKHEAYRANVDVLLELGGQTSIKWTLQAPDKSYIQTDELTGTDEGQLMQLMMKRIRSAMRPAK